MDRMIALSYTSEFLHARTHAVSPFSHGHSGTYPPGPTLLVSPGVARDRHRAMISPARPVAGTLGHGRAGRPGRRARLVARSADPAPSAGPVGAGRCQTLGDRVMSRLSGSDRGGRARMALAARDGGPAGGASSAPRSSAPARLSLRCLSGGRVALPG